MNERIGELYTQALEYADSKVPPERRYNDIYFAIVSGKHAELIVKECVDKVDKTGFAFNEQPQYNDKQNALVSEGFFWALESVKQQIREHFGVEE